MSLTKVHNRMFAQTVFNVKDYGALGDDSNDDTAAAQAAIDAAETEGGGVVLFPEGTYLLNSFYSGYTPSGRSNDVARLYIDGDNISFVGQGAKLTTSTGDGDRRHFFFANGSENIHFEGFIFDNKGVASTTRRTQAITTNGTKNITIQKCTVENECLGFFIGKNSQYTSITECHIDGSLALNTGGDDAKPSGDQTDGTVSDIVISKCFIENCSEAIDINHDTTDFIISENYITLSSGSEEALDIGGSTVCRNGVISNNFIVVNSADADGILLKQETKDVEVTGNRINYTAATSTTNYGVRLNASNLDNFKITDNTIKNFSRGIVSETSAGTNFTINQNFIADCATSGIVIHATFGSISDNIIDMSDSGNTGTAMQLLGSQFNCCGNNITGNSNMSKTFEIDASNTVCKGNNIVGGVVPVTLNANNIVFDGNSISSGTSTAIDVDGPENVVVSNNIVFNNDSASSATATIDFANVTNGSATGNMIYDTRSSGQTELGKIVAAATCDFILFANNTISNTVTSPGQVTINGAVSNSSNTDNLV